MNATIKFYTDRAPDHADAVGAITLPAYGLRFDVLIRHDERGNFVEWPRRHWDRNRTAVQTDDFGEWNTWILESFAAFLATPGRGGRNG